MVAGTEFSSKIDMATDNAVLPAAECSDNLIFLMKNVDTYLRQLDIADIDSAPNFSEAAEDYSEAGFLIRAAALKRIAGSIYSRNNYHDLAELEIIDAIGLARLGYRMAKVGLSDFIKDEDIRRSAYPHMYLWDRDIRSIKVLGSPVGDTPGTAIYRFMKECYRDLMQNIGRTGALGIVKTTERLLEDDLAMFSHIDAYEIGRITEVDTARVGHAVYSGYIRGEPPLWTKYADWCSYDDRWADIYRL